MAWKRITSPPAIKFHVVMSVIITVFWDSEAIVLTDYLEHGSTITGTYYADLIGQCRAVLKENT